MEPHYLCKWHFYAAPTWEPRRVLLDLGHGNALRAFDDAHDAMSRRPAVRNDDDCSRRGGGEPLAVTRVGSFFAVGATKQTVFESLFPDFVPFICNELASAGLRATAIANIAPPGAAAALLRRWASLPTAIPMRVFHGSGRHNCGGILARGLVIPGTGRNAPKVQNGSAYGVAVYSARHPHTPHSYARGCNSMFVCVALNSKELVAQGLVKNVNTDWYIFFENSLIVPVWVVSYSDSNYSSQPVSSGRRLEVRLETDWRRVVQPLDEAARAGDADEALDAAYEHVMPEGTVEDKKLLVDTARLPRRKRPFEGNSWQEKRRDDPTANAESRVITRGKPATKRMVKQMPRSMKAAFGY
jgi:hypothetical protein